MLAGMFFCVLLLLSVNLMKSKHWFNSTGNRKVNVKVMMFLCMP